MHVSTEQRRHRLARRHGLVPDERLASVTDGAEAMVALHSSDPLSVFLALRARLADPSIGEIEQALYVDRRVVRLHAMRRTLWVTTVPTAELVHAACTRKIAAAERRRTVALLDGDEEWLDDAIARISALLATDGPLTARVIGDRLPELGRTLVLGAGSAHEGTTSGHSRALLQAGFEGTVVRAAPAGGWTSSQYAWADPPSWVSIDWSRWQTDAAAAALVERWLARFGPGTVDDIVWWSGLTKTAVRRALETIEVAEVGLDGGSVGLVLATDTGPVDPVEAWVALLPGLDPTVMGWKQRDWYLDRELAARVTDRFGNIGPTIWVSGRVVGGWAQRPDGTIASEVHESLSADEGVALHDEIERVRRFLGDARVKVRFPPRGQRELLA